MRPAENSTVCSVVGNMGIGDPGWVIFAKRQLPWIAALDWAISNEFFAEECGSITGLATATPTDPTIKVTMQPASGLNEILRFILGSKTTIL